MKHICFWAFMNEDVCRPLDLSPKQTDKTTEDGTERDRMHLWFEANLYSGLFVTSDYSYPDSLYSGFPAAIYEARVHIQKCKLDKGPRNIGHNRLMLLPNHAVCKYLLWKRRWEREREEKRDWRWGTFKHVFCFSSPQKGPQLSGM